MQFEKITIEQSIKDIPIPNNYTYIKRFIVQLESFIRRLRWKAFFFDHKNNETDNNTDYESYGFKTERCPPQHPCLTAFENDLYDLSRSIQFQKYGNQFQHQLSETIKNITSSQNVIVPADKSSNYYKVPIKEYVKLLNNNITSKYKKSNKKNLECVNKETKIIACKLNLQNKIQCYPSNSAFITLKDHKDNFRTNPKCRLINPAKSEIGKVSKFHLDKINQNIRKKTSLNQWQNTSSVIDWFNSIPDKKNCKFLKFDIVEFYPSITEKLLKESINFAKQFATIDDEIIRIILNARKSFLFDLDSNPWVKKDNSMFDVTMGSYDGAEVCELVGLFILYKITTHSNIFCNKLVGLYRDDGLAVLHCKSGPEMENIRKKLIQLFKSMDLQITTESNLQFTDFLDVTFDLRMNSYKPFRKSGNPPLYVNSDSNHPPSIKKEIPNMIEKRLSSTSCNKAAFDAAADIYNKGLQNSGYSTCIQYQKLKNKEKEKQRTRKRNVIWFNPPFSNHVLTNIGKLFFQILDKHFPKTSRLHKIFNRNTVKLSYSCMPNLANIISNHNKKVLNQHTANKLNSNRTCNCKNNSMCPLNGNCLKKSIVYKATLSTTDNDRYYYGLCETTFKSRYYNHKQSFKNNSKRNSTELSKAVWNLKENNIDYNLYWTIIKETPPYKIGSKLCNLCISEKIEILKANPSTLLNKRSEIIGKCRHKNKFLLKHFPT